MGFYWKVIDGPFFFFPVKVIYGLFFIFYFKNMFYKLGQTDRFNW